MKRVVNTDAVFIAVGIRLRDRTCSKAAGASPLTKRDMRLRARVARPMCQAYSLRAMLRETAAPSDNCRFRPGANAATARSNNEPRLVWTLSS